MEENDLKHEAVFEITLTFKGKQLNNYSLGRKMASNHDMQFSYKDYLNYNKEKFISLYNQKYTDKEIYSIRKQKNYIYFGFKINDNLTSDGEIQLFNEDEAFEKINAIRKSEMLIYSEEFTDILEKYFINNRGAVFTLKVNKNNKIKIKNELYNNDSFDYKTYFRRNEKKINSKITDKVGGRSILVMTRRLEEGKFRVEFQILTNK
jgi:hypothetical protein